MNGCLTHNQVLDVVFCDNDILSNISLLRPRDYVLREVCATADPGIFVLGIYPPGPVNDIRQEKFGKDIDQPEPVIPRGLIPLMVENTGSRVTGSIVIFSIAPGFARMPKSTSPPSRCRPGGPCT